jgi:CRP-like cAMP-binding protein
MCTETLKEFKLFSGMRDKEIDLICEASDPEMLEFESNVCVLVQGEPVLNIDFLVEGKMVSQKNHVDGHVQLVNSYKSRSIINLEAAASNKGTSPFFLVTVTPCRIIRIPYKKLIHNRLLPIAITEKIYDNIFAYMADDSIRFMNKSDVLSRRSARDRILIFLSIVRERDGRNDIDIGMNQTQFAQYLCMDRTSLTATISKLRRENLIEYSGSKYLLKFPDIAIPKHPSSGGTKSEPEQH